MTASLNPLAFWHGLLYALPVSVALWAALLVGVTVARAEPVWNAADAAVAIADAAVLYGVPESQLLRVARCEAPGIEPGAVDPYAVGDSGHSFGLAQLNDRSTGLLAHYHGLGYGSAFDPYSAADYLGRVFSGEFVGQGITWRRWSCR